RPDRAVAGLASFGDQSIETQRSSTVNSSATTRFVRVPQVRTDVGAVYGVLSHFADEGSGEALVLIHGGGVAAQGHLGWTAAIGPLAKQYRVIAPDLLWSGLTDKPATQYSFRTQVDHVAGLLDTLGIERAHILGQSIGAYLAARFACDYPQRTGRL